MFASANSRHKVTPPKPLYRPGAKAPDDRIGAGHRYTVAEMRAILDDWRQGGDDSWQVSSLQTHT